MNVPTNELHIAFVRSQGPGGQNVNKTSSKAQLRWNLSGSRTFSAAEKAILARKLSPYLTAGGEIILSSEHTRSQIQNKSIVIKRLNTLVSQALIPDVPRVATKPTRASKLKRLDRKKEHSKKKKTRRFLDLFFF